ncbi:hypothetical protein AALB51_20465 [Lachnospiraceae bacterium 62-26]
MKNHFDEIISSIAENITGIVSEGMTEREVKLICSAISGFFTVDERLIVTLIKIDDCLAYILAVLMDGLAEEE